MAATYTAHKALARSERRLVEYDSDDALNLVDLGQPQGGSAECLAIANYRRFVGGLVRTVGTGTVDKFELIAATSAAGAGAVIVAAHAIGSPPNLINDTIWLEADVEQVREVLAAATHVGLRVELATATDECAFYFERLEPFYPKANLTADFIG